MTLFGGIIRGIAERREREAREAVITFVLALLLSLIIYCVPVLIYRFGIRHGAPLESKWKATWVGLIFWNCSFAALCLYYLISGYYDNGDFSVRAGPLDFICLSINWFLLYFPFKKTSKSKSKCTKCGAPLSPNAKFCTECGEKYVPKPVVDTMTCPSCGKTIKPTNFCPECGSKISQTSVQNKPSSGIYVDSLGRIQPQNGSHTRDDDDEIGDVTRSIVIFIFMVVVVFAVIIAILMWLLN
jgi:hypothetical protein